MKKINILFVCIHNSARSQMAEAFINELYGEKFSAQSAGIEPGKLNQTVVQSMHEIGIDISRNQTKSVHELHKAGKKFDYVITVCDREAAQRCPIFVSKNPNNSSVKHLHWGFPDPSALTGSENQLRTRTREIRNMIKNKVQDFANNF